MTQGAFQSSAKPILCVSAGFGVSVFCTYQYVAKIDPSGTQLIYATYLDGTYGAQPIGIAVDGEGNAIISGWTNSFDYPTTAGSFEPGYPSQPSGYYFPPSLTVAPSSAGYITKLNATGTALVWSTFLAGTAPPPPPNQAIVYGDSISSMVVDTEGNIIVSGSTASPGFPGLAPSGARPSGSNPMNFVARLSPSGTELSPVELLSTGGGSAVAAGPFQLIVATGSQISAAGLSPACRRSDCSVTPFQPIRP